MLKNEMGISKIRIEESLKCICTISEKPYTNQLIITLTPDEVLPEYISLHELIQELTMKHLIIEEAVASVLDIIKESIDPLEIRVTSYVEDAPHPIVTVTKSYWR